MYEMRLKHQLFIFAGSLPPNPSGISRSLPVISDLNRNASGSASPTRRRRVSVSLRQTTLCAFELSVAVSSVSFMALSIALRVSNGDVSAQLSGVSGWSVGA